MSNKTVVVGLSGGVDSPQALLLKRQGWEGRRPVHEKLGKMTIRRSIVLRARDLIDVMSVWTGSAPTWKWSISPPSIRVGVCRIPAEYQAGRTPNPDIPVPGNQVPCLPRPHALKLVPTRSPPAITPACASSTANSSCSKPRTGPRTRSYFLYRLNQEQLAKSIFPWPTSTSARCERLPDAEGCRWRPKKDSTGSASSASDPSREFLMRYPPKQKGSVAWDDGKVLGSTMASCTTRSVKGRACTSGRQGSRVKRRRRPRSVVRRRQGYGEEHPLRRPGPRSSRPLPGYPGMSNFPGSSGQAPHTHWVYTAKPRYRTADQPCEVDRSTATPCRRSTLPNLSGRSHPGQSVVVYESGSAWGGIIR